METVCGIVAEYNPFHNGHLYQIKQTREKADCIAVVMSGHFTQRGDLACFSKWTRAKAALLCGADLVVELPVPFACASAERFALGSISILAGLGCVDLVSFGSESGNLAALEACAQACLQVDGSPEMQAALRKGLSYPRARQQALGETGELLSQPNNTLGIEYIKAAKKLGVPLSFLTVKRMGAGHDSSRPDSQFASASYLRGQLKQGLSMDEYLPPQALTCYQGQPAADFSRLETALLYRLRTMGKEEFAALPDVTEGLENRLHAAARRAISVEGFLLEVKTKRYTLSRLRRILCAALLGLTKRDQQELPPYARVLGCTERGKGLLARARKSSDIAVSPDFSFLARQFPRQTDLEARATDLFSLALPQVGRCGLDFLERPVILP